MPNDNEFELLTKEQAIDTVDELEPSEVPNAETAEVEHPPIPDDFELICARERADREYDEFKSLFPDMSLAELPDGVLDDIRSGMPLCAACALYERRRAVALADAERANSENRERSFVLHTGGRNEAYFTSDEVKEMSSAEVRTNYKKIIESMNHWT